MVGSVIFKKTWKQQLMVKCWNGKTLRQIQWKFEHVKSTKNFHFAADTRQQLNFKS